MAAGSTAPLGRAPAAASLSRVARKLCLIVVDSLRMDMLRRTVVAGEAPHFGALLDRGELVDDCVSSFPTVTPVCNAEIATGARPGPMPDGAPGHGIMGMNWYHRVERALRRVRQLARGDPRLRPLPQPLRRRLQHEHVPPLARGGDGVRAPRRRRRAQRLHPVFHLPRPHPPRARARGPAAQGRPGRQLPPRHLGPRRALLGRALRRPGRCPASRPSPAPAPATSTPAASAASCSARTPTTSSSSASPTTTTTPTRTVPRRGRLDRARRPRLRRAGRGGRRDRGLLRRARGDPDRRPRADRRPGGLRPRRAARRRVAGAGAQRPGPRGGRARRQPRPPAPAPSTSSPRAGAGCARTRTSARRIGCERRGRRALPGSPGPTGARSSAPASARPTWMAPRR